MNRLKFLLVSLLGLFIVFNFVSCSHETEFMETNAIITENPNAKSFSIQELLTISKQFNNDYAVFDDINQYSNFVNSYSNINQTDKDLLLGSISYVSIDKYLDNLLTELDRFTTREEVVRFVRNNEKYLKMVINKNGDEEVEFQNISYYHSRPFLNQDQIVKVGDEFFKYISNLCVRSKDLSSLKQLKTVSDIKNSSLKYDTVAKLLFKSSENLDNNSRWGDEGVPYIFEEIHDPSWCKNDRKVRLTLEFVTSINTFWDPIFGTTYQHTVSRSALLEGRKKGIPCIWYGYSTVLTWNNFDFRYRIYFNGTITSHTWTFANTEQTSSGIHRHNQIQFYVENWDLCDFEWTKKRTSASSRGMAGKWLEVDE